MIFKRSIGYFNVYDNEYREKLSTATHIVSKQILTIGFYYFSVGHHRRWRHELGNASFNN